MVLRRDDTSSTLGFSQLLIQLKFVKLFLCWKYHSEDSPVESHTALRTNKTLNVTSHFLINKERLFNKKKLLYHNVEVLVHIH